MNFYILSSVGHKEQRFMTQVFMPFAICWSFAAYKFQSFLPRFAQTLLKFYLQFHILCEIGFTIKQHNSACFGEKEIYTLYVNDSPIFLDYSNYPAEEMAKYNFTGFDRVESFNVMHSLDTPVFLWSHQPGGALDKITVVSDDTGWFPGFVQSMYLYHFQDLENKYPGLKVNHEVDSAS